MFIFVPFYLQMILKGNNFFYMMTLYYVGADNNFIMGRLKKSKRSPDTKSKLKLLE